DRSLAGVDGHEAVEGLDALGLLLGLQVDGEAAPGAELVDLEVGVAGQAGAVDLDEVRAGLDVAHDGRHDALLEGGLDGADGGRGDLAAGQQADVVAEKLVVAPVKGGGEVAMSLRAG